MTLPGQRWRLGWTAILMSGLMMTSSPRLALAQSVDLELLLAVDVSPSVDPVEYDLQMRGLEQALRDPSVVNAIKAAPHGLALALMQWAGPGEQNLSVAWSEVRDQASADAFAAKISAIARLPTNGGTALGDALSRCVSLLAESNVKAARRIIDISGDGRTNEGDSPAPMRTYAVQAGITVNGLVIDRKERQLSRYYRDFVIGGPGAFVLQINGFEDFARAMRKKLIREIEIAMAADPSAADRSGVLH